MGIYDEVMTEEREFRRSGLVQRTTWTRTTIIQEPESPFATSGPMSGHGLEPRNEGFALRNSDAGSVSVDGTAFG